MCENATILGEYTGFGRDDLPPLRYHTGLSTNPTGILGDCSREVAFGLDSRVNSEIESMVGAS